MQLPKQVRTVITGAGSGLGKELALNLARRGARLVLSDIDELRAEETAVLAREMGAAAEAQGCDVGELEEVEALRDRAHSLWGGTDLLINNAGVAVAGSVGEIPLDDWEWITRINQWGVVYGCHSFLPAMKEAGRGWILNVASFAGIATLPEVAPYNVTKAAVIALSETLYGECAPYGVAVSVLCPTFFPTRLMESFRGGDRQKRLAHKLFAASSARADEVARRGVAGLERGELHIVPQLDGRVLRRIKGLLPQSYAKVMRRRYAADKLA